MNKKYVIGILVVIIIFIVYKSSTELPPSAPKTHIKYNNKNLSTNLGDHNWISQKNGGNSYIAIGDYALGEKLTKVNAKSGDTIYISIPHHPIKVEIVQMLDNNFHHKDYTLTKYGDKYLFTLPTEKGDYIFDVLAYWDDNHNTATIFRVNVE